MHIDSAACSFPIDLTNLWIKYSNIYLSLVFQNNLLLLKKKKIIIIRKKKLNPDIDWFLDIYIDGATNSFLISIFF